MARCREPSDKGAYEYETFDAEDVSSTTEFRIPNFMSLKTPTNTKMFLNRLAMLLTQRGFSVEKHNNFITVTHPSNEKTNFYPVLIDKECTGEFTMKGKIIKLPLWLQNTCMRFNTYELFMDFYPELPTGDAEEKNRRKGTVGAVRSFMELHKMTPRHKESYGNATKEAVINKEVKSNDIGNALAFFFEASRFGHKEGAFADALVFTVTCKDWTELPKRQTITKFNLSFGSVHDDVRQLKMIFLQCPHDKKYVMSLGKVFLTWLQASMNRTYHLNGNLYVGEPNLDITVTPSSTECKCRISPLFRWISYDNVVEEKEGEKRTLSIHRVLDNGDTVERPQKVKFSALQMSVKDYRRIALDTCIKGGFAAQWMSKNQLVVARRKESRTVLEVYDTGICIHQSDVFDTHREWSLLCTTEPTEKCQQMLEYLNGLNKQLEDATTDDQRNDILHFYEDASEVEQKVKTLYKKHRTDTATELEKLYGKETVVYLQPLQRTNNTMYAWKPHEKQVKRKSKTSGHIAYVGANGSLGECNDMVRVGDTSVKQDGEHKILQRNNQCIELNDSTNGTLFHVDEKKFYNGLYLSVCAFNSTVCVIMNIQTFKWELPDGWTCTDIAVARSYSFVTAVWNGSISKLIKWTYAEKLKWWQAEAAPLYVCEKEIKRVHSFVSTYTFEKEFRLAAEVEDVEERGERARTVWIWSPYKNTDDIRIREQKKEIVAPTVACEKAIEACNADNCVWFASAAKAKRLVGNGGLNSETKNAAFTMIQDEAAENLVKKDMIQIVDAMMRSVRNKDIKKATLEEQLDELDADSEDENEVKKVIATAKDLKKAVDETRERAHMMRLLNPAQKQSFTVDEDKKNVLKFVMWCRENNAPLPITKAVSKWRNQDFETMTRMLQFDGRVNPNTSMYVYGRVDKMRCSASRMLCVHKLGNSFVLTVFRNINSEKRPRPLSINLSSKPDAVAIVDMNDELAYVLVTHDGRLLLYSVSDTIRPRAGFYIEGDVEGITASMEHRDLRAFMLLKNKTLKAVTFKHGTDLVKLTECGGEIVDVAAMSSEPFDKNTVPIRYKNGKLALIDIDKNNAIVENTSEEVVPRKIPIALSTWGSSFVDLIKKFDREKEQNKWEVYARGEFMLRRDKEIFKVMLNRNGIFYVIKNGKQKQVCYKEYIPDPSPAAEPEAEPEEDAYGEIADRSRRDAVIGRAERSCGNALKTHVIQTIMGYHHDRSIINVLDVACGKGGDAQKFNDVGRPIKLYIGMDKSQNQIEDANKRVENGAIRRNNIRTVSFMRIEFDRTGVHNLKFNTIVCFFALHYMFETEQQFKQFMSNIRDCASPTCTVAIITVNREEVLTRTENLTKPYVYKDRTGEGVFSVTPSPGEIEIKDFGTKYKFNFGGRGEDKRVNFDEYVVKPSIVTEAFKKLGFQTVHNQNALDYFNGRHSECTDGYLKFYRVFIFKREAAVRSAAVRSAAVGAAAGGSAAGVSRRNNLDIVTEAVFFLWSRPLPDVKALIGLHVGIKDDLKTHLQTMSDVQYEEIQKLFTMLIDIEYLVTAVMNDYQKNVMHKTVLEELRNFLNMRHVTADTVRDKLVLLYKDDRIEYERIHERFESDVEKLKKTHSGGRAV